MGTFVDGAGGLITSASVVEVLMAARVESDNSPLTVNGELSDSTRAAIKTSTTEALVIKPPAPATNVPTGFSGNGPPPTPLPQVTGYVPEMIALLIGSPEFQRR